MTHYNHCQLRNMIETPSLSTCSKTTEGIIYLANILPCIATLYPLWPGPFLCVSPCQLACAVRSGSRVATLQPGFWRSILGVGLVEMHHFIGRFFALQKAVPWRRGCEKRTFRIFIAELCDIYISSEHNNEFLAMWRCGEIATFESQALAGCN